MTQETLTFDSASFGDGYEALYDNDLGTFAGIGNLPGGIAVAAVFDFGAQKRIVKVGVKWGGAGEESGEVTEGDALTLQLGTNPANPFADIVDVGACASLGMPGDLVYREYTLPVAVECYSVVARKLFDGEPINAVVFEITAFSETEIVAPPETPSLFAVGRLVDNVPQIYVSGE